MAKLSEAQTKTLMTIIANGGEMNGYAGQRGFYCNSLRPLRRMGLIEDVAMCAGCSSRNEDGAQAPCAHGGACYNRVRVTVAGRAAVAPSPATEVKPEPERPVEPLASDITVTANMFDPALTYYADGTRVVMRWVGGERRGVTAGRIAGAPYAFQVVSFDDGGTANVAPHVLTPERYERPEWDYEPRSIAPDAYTRTAVYLGESRDV